MALEHKWNGSVLTITSDSGSSAADLKGPKGDTGPRGPRGLAGPRGGGAQIEDGLISTDTTWSSSAIMDNFADVLVSTGNPVIGNPIPNYPLHIQTIIGVNQSGSGEASPTNIRPISGMDAVSVVRCGKNLLNYDEWKNVSIQKGTAVFENNGITLTATGDDCFTDYDSTMKKARVYLNKGETITLSWQESENKEGIVYIFPNGKTPGMRSVSNVFAKELKYTAGEGVEYITFRFGVSKSGTTISYKNIQIEMGSTATAFEKYNGNTFTLSIGETIYSGELDWNTGVLTVDKGYYVLTGNDVEGSSTVAGTNETADICFWIPGNLLIPLMEKGNYLEGYCSHFYNNRTKRDKNTIRFGANTQTIYFYMSSSDYPTVADFNAYAAAQAAAGTPIQIVYPLYEPITIQLTEQEIKAIKGVNTLYTDAAEMMVSGRIDTMYQLSQLAARVAALEAAIINA